MFPAPGVVYHHFVNEGGDQPTTDMLRLLCRGDRCERNGKRPARDVTARIARAAQCAICAGEIYIKRGFLGRLLLA
jgi:hypothetical protein